MCTHTYHMLFIEFFFLSPAMGVIFSIGFIANKVRKQREKLKRTNIYLLSPAMCKVLWRFYFTPHFGLPSLLLMAILGCGSGREDREN